MSRLKPVDPAGFTSEQQRLVASRPERVTRGPYTVWLHRPMLAERMHAVLSYVRSQSGLPKRLYELAILVAARDWTAQFAWYAHAEPSIRDP